MAVAQVPAQEAVSVVAPVAVPIAVLHVAPAVSEAMVAVTDKKSLLGNK